MPLDPQAQTVIDTLDRIGGVPLATLTPADARRRPNVADAVRALLWEEGTSLSPEPVGAVEEVEVPGPQGFVPVRIYWPLGADPGPVPVLVYAHGGGWVVGDLDAYDATPRALANRSGCIVVSVGYRHAPEHPFPMAHDDMLVATRWVMGDIGELGGDPARVAVGGEGAGATMAIATCMSLKQAGSDLPLFQLLLYPITGLERTDWPSYREHLSARPLSTQDVEWAVGHVLAHQHDLDDVRLSPGGATPSQLNGLPTTLVVTAQHDPLRDQGEAFGMRLLDAGVNATTLRFEGVPHDFVTMNPVVAPARMAVAVAGKHLRDAFKMKGETAPTVEPDLAQVLAAHHAGLSTLLDQLEQGRGHHHELIDQLRHGFSAHAAMLGSVPGDAGKGVSNRVAIEVLLGLLDAEVRGDELEAGLQSVRSAIDDHRVHEERELAEMRHAIGNTRMRELGRKALEARNSAPRHHGADTAMAHAG